MTPCEEYQEAWGALLDGECPPEEEARLRAHLLECESCREALADWAAIREAFPTWEEEPVPKDFAQRVLRRCGEQPAPKRKHYFGAWASLAACLAVIALLSGLPRRADSTAAAEEAVSYQMQLQGPEEAVAGSAEGRSDEEMAADGSAAPGDTAEDTAALRKDGTRDPESEEAQSGWFSWVLTAEDEDALLSAYPVEETAEGHLYALTAEELEAVQEDAEARGIPQPDPDPVLGQTAAAMNTREIGGSDGDAHFWVWVTPAEA